MIKKLLPIFIICFSLIQCVEQTKIKTTYNRFYIIYITNWKLENSAQITTVIKNKITEHLTIVLINNDLPFSSDTTQNQLIIDILNKSQVDAIMFTSSIIDNNIENIQKLIKKSNFYWLAANIKNNNINSFLGYEYLIKPINNLKIGIIGVIFDTINSSILKQNNLELQNPEYTIKKLIPLLTNRVDLLCLMTNTQDTINFPVDIILGAPSRTSFYINHNNENNNIYQLEIIFDRNYQLVEIKKSTIQLNNISEDSIISKIINEHKQK